MLDRSTPARIVLWSAAITGALIAGCSRHYEEDLVVGRDGQAGAPQMSGGQAGSTGATAGRSGSTTPASGGARALVAAIQNREGVTLDVVTVGCAGECFEVVAVARGGYPPYTYRWKDGSTSAERKLCPEASQSFEVMATDHGYESEEFRRAPETVTAAVTAEVLACPDAGVSDAGSARPVDAGMHGGSGIGWRPLCIENGSFEEDDGYSWRACPTNEPSAYPVTTTQAAAADNPEVPDGEWYLRMDPQPGRPVSISLPICIAVGAGIGYYWSQAWTLGAGSGPVRVELFFSQTECGLDGKQSDVVPTESWTRVCSAWPAQWDAYWLTIRATATGDTAGTVFFDELLSSSAFCPPLEHGR